MPLRNQLQTNPIEGVLFQIGKVENTVYYPLLKARQYGSILVLSYLVPGWRRISSLYQALWTIPSCLIFASVRSFLSQFHDHTGLSTPFYKLDVFNIFYFAFTAQSHIVCRYKQSLRGLSNCGRGSGIHVQAVYYSNSGEGADPKTLAKDHFCLFSDFFCFKWSSYLAK